MESKKISKEDVMGIVKPGLIYSGAAVIMGLIVSTLLGLVIYKGVPDSGLLGFNMIFGAAVKWHCQSENMLDIKIALSLPCLGLGLAVLIFWCSEKLSIKVTDHDRTWQENILISLLCGILFAVIALIMGGSRITANGSGMEIKAEDLEQYTRVVKTTVRPWFISTFLNVSMLSFFTLNFVMKVKSARPDGIIATSRTVMGILLGFAALLSFICQGVLTLREDAVMSLAKLISGFIVMTGAIVSVMFTGRYDLLRLTQNGETKNAMSMSLTGIRSIYAGYPEKTGNPLVVVLILLMLITFVTLLTAAYRYWDKRGCTKISDGLLEAAGSGLSTGFMVAVLGKMAAVMGKATFKADTDQLGVAFVEANGQYQLGAGDAFTLKTMIITGIIVFVIYMLAYGLAALKNAGIQRAVELFSVKLLCLIMLISSGIIAVMLGNTVVQGQLEGESVIDDYEMLKEDTQYAFGKMVRIVTPQLAQLLMSESEE